MSDTVTEVTIDSVVQDLVDKSQVEFELKSELHVLKPFEKALSNKPGCNELVKHSIKLEGAVSEITKIGNFDESEPKWAAPIVVVKKSNNSDHPDRKSVV